MEDISFLLVTLGMTVFGGLFEVWGSTLIGVGVSDVKLDKYDNEIKKGAFLMMVGVLEGRESEIDSVIHRHHPDVIIEITTPKEQTFWGQGP